jgi:hypothetical protein
MSTTHYIRVLQFLKPWRRSVSIFEIVKQNISLKGPQVSDFFIFLLFFLRPIPLPAWPCSLRPPPARLAVLRPRPPPDHHGTVARPLRDRRRLALHPFAGIWDWPHALWSSDLAASRAAPVAIAAQARSQPRRPPAIAPDLPLPDRR